jgi:uncharacterized membrane protein YphA (DoxX/SURF4 family)
MSLIRFTARALIGAATVSDGVAAFRRPGPHEEVAAPALDWLAKTTGKTLSAGRAVRATAVAQTAGGALIATSIAPRLGALASLAPNLAAVLLGHRFWRVKDDDSLRAASRASFFSHLALVGADLLILAGPTGRRRRHGARAAGRGGRCRARKAAKPA